MRLGMSRYNFQKTVKFEIPLQLEQPGNSSHVPGHHFLVLLCQIIIDWSLQQGVSLSSLFLS